MNLINGEVATGNNYAHSDVLYWEFCFKDGSKFLIDTINSDEMVKTKKYTTVKLDGSIFPLDFINKIKCSKNVKKLKKYYLMRNAENGKDFHFNDEFTNLKIDVIKKSNREISIILRAKNKYKMFL